MYWSFQIKSPTDVIRLCYEWTAKYGSIRKGRVGPWLIEVVLCDPDAIKCVMSTGGKNRFFHIKDYSIYSVRFLQKKNLYLSKYIAMLQYFNVTNFPIVLEKAIKYCIQSPNSKQDQMYFGLP